MTNTFIILVLYKWKVLANGEHPFMIRITQDRKRKYVTINESCNPKYWDFKKNKLKRSHPQFDVLESLLSKRLKAYNDIRLTLAEDNQHFTPEELIEKVDRPVKSGTVMNFLDTIIEGLESDDKIGNARVYKDTRRVLQCFLKNKDISFLRINKVWLESFEKHLRSEKMTEVSISVYFRTLRSIFNKAIDKNYVRGEHYPFRTFKVSKFNTSTQKRAITREEMSRIKNMDLSKHPEAETARQYFLFSYYGCGINFIDIAKLTGENLKSGRIFYTRAKTGTDVNFRLTEEALQIIKHFNPARSFDRKEYLFPILDRNIHKTALQIDNRYKKIMGEVNDGLKTIAKLAKLSEELTFYVARHSYATACNNSGAPVSVTQKSMGHSSLKTTEIYLKQFPNEEADSIIEKAIAI